jgi:1-acyl-sn-glycerol-3-phosphate acyltransferase
MSEQGADLPCQAWTQAGAQCRNRALPGSAYCHVHRAWGNGEEEGGLTGSKGPVLEAEAVEEGEPSSLLPRPLGALLGRLRDLVPGFEPPPLSVAGLMGLIERLAGPLPHAVHLEIGKRVREALQGGWFDPQALEGMWYMLNYALQYNADMLRRRYRGEYETDAWGLDWEFLDAMRPLLTLLYKVYWRVEATGIEQIPVQGGALLVANHSGLLPWDGLMVGMAVLTQHPAQRLVRTLHGDWWPAVPFLSHTLVKLGGAPATMEDGLRLLQAGELVAVYPEGAEGAGKLCRDRYKLGRFRQVQVASLALSAGAPILPVSVVGAEETYLTLGQSRALARATHLPQGPITPAFPWLGLLGLVPLPSKWYIDVGDPIVLEGYAPEEAGNLVLAAQLTDRVRHTLQEMIRDRLAQRRSIFF